MGKVKTYSITPAVPEKVAKARGSNMRVHFKNTRETAQAIKGMGLKRARVFLQDVIDHKQCVAFRRFNGGVGRTAQAKAHNWTQGRWPEKSARFLLDLLLNAEDSANQKELDVDKLKLTHIQVNRAPKTRRRTYRAHGRISAYMRSPCHIELVFTEQEEPVRLPGKAGRGKVLGQSLSEQKSASN